MRYFKERRHLTIKQDDLMQQTLTKSDSLSGLGSQSLTKGHMSKKTMRQPFDKKRLLLSIRTPFVSVGVLVGKNVK